MTVCVAAISDRSSIIGVTDRMLTAGDVEFEPAQAKMWAFSRAVWGLISGDYNIQSEILSRVDTEIKRRIAVQPDVWVSVKEVAELYCKRYKELLRSRAEAAILHPLGLDIPTFLSQQASMNPDLVVELAAKLTTYDFDSTLEMLFIGNDHDGPDEKATYVHLYKTEADKLSNCSQVGFAAIGIGRFHAESQFMFSGHWPSKPFHETLSLAYAAKKRAEVAPGVGKDTDIVVIGPGLGGSLKVEERHIAGLEKIYQKSRSRSTRALKSALDETKEFIAKVRKEYDEITKKKAEESASSAEPKQSNL